MLRKQILKKDPTPSNPQPGEKDIGAIATVHVTSEDKNHPIEHAFDAERGPGASRWVAEELGEQRVILAFDVPQAIRKVRLEIEEPDVSRTQELVVTVSCDGGQSFRELVRQEYNFSPSGTTFEVEEWSTKFEGVTHLQLFIKPDKGGRPCRATITSLTVQ